jgi:hypothetical protein
MDAVIALSAAAETGSTLLRLCSACCGDDDILFRIGEMVEIKGTTTRKTYVVAHTRHNKCQL